MTPVGKLRYGVVCRTSALLPLSAAPSMPSSESGRSSYLTPAALYICSIFSYDGDSIAYVLSLPSRSTISPYRYSAPEPTIICSVSTDMPRFLARYCRSASRSSIRPECGERSSISSPQSAITLRIVLLSSDTENSGLLCSIFFPRVGSDGLLSDAAKPSERRKTTKYPLRSRA